MKKTLSLILAILMIVTSIPFAFASESFAITHQPTAEEDYIKTLLEQRGIHVAVALYYSNVALVECLCNHLLNYARYAWNVWRWL